MPHREANIYHCQKCGRVSNRDCSHPVPDCCGEAMAVAVAHIRYESESGECSTDEVIEKSHQFPR